MRPEGARRCGCGLLSFNCQLTSMEREASAEDNGNSGLFAPSGSSPTDSGERRTMSREGISSRTQTRMLRTIHAWRQSELEISQWMSGGKEAVLAPMPNVIRAVARPLRRTNQMAVRVVGMRVREPWPRVRMPAKPR